MKKDEMGCFQGTSSERKSLQRLLWRILLPYIEKRPKKERQSGAVELSTVAYDWMCITTSA
jgi:hypothetical protein